VIFASITFETGFVEPVNLTEAGFVPIVSETPVCSGGAVLAFIKSPAKTFVPMICAFTIAVTAFCGARLIDAASGNPAAANAASVGAKTVYLPLLLTAVAKPARTTAARRTSKLLLPETTSAILSVGGINTSEITCITPLAACTFAVLTLMPFTKTPLALLDAYKF
jgi:hypothetical protein